MEISWQTLQIIASIVSATTVIVWRVAKAAADLQKMLADLDKKVAILETKTTNVTHDHDLLVLTAQKSDAAHRRLDELYERAGNE
jgi:malate/lactate dehydrogenase